MRVKVKRKKNLSFLASRRQLERTRLSFLFVLFFFGLFGIIIVMEGFTETKNGKYAKENGDEGSDEDSSKSGDESTDVWYEQQPAAFPLKFPHVVVNASKQAGFPGGGRPPTIGAGRGTTMKETLNKIPISDWQIVYGSAEKFYVYSAYYVPMPSNVIRVIGATKTKTHQRVQCRLYDNGTNHYSTVDGSIRTIRENWNLKYSACFIICHLPAGTNTIYPRYVSILTSVSPTASPSNILRVQYSSDKTESPVNFSVCVKPIFNYDNVLQFLEWMEFHRLMGVDHFTFYNHSMGEKLSCLLEKVYGDEEVTVFPWTLPLVSQTEIRTEGLFAAFNDCVYRHRGASKYLIIVDLDEMIVPRRTHNYTQLLTQLDTLSHRGKIAAYSIQNAFFYLQWPNDMTNYNLSHYPLAETLSQNLLMLRKTRRRAHLHPHKQRSKYICDPEKVVEAGNHFVWEMLAGYSTLPVPSHLAALHHYRVCEFGGNQCTKSPSIVDKSSQQFGQLLAIKVADKLQSFLAKCHSSYSP